MSEFYVEQQGWAHWPKVLIMCRKKGRGVTRRRYVPEVETGEGMSITKELRNYAGELDIAASMMSEHGFSPVAMKLTAIADRIDAEHDECKDFCRRIEEASKQREEVTLFGVDYIPLPVDADGEPVHIGDVMEWPTTGETFEVVGIGDGTLFYIEDGSELADWTGASTKRHHHAPTVEDVLREFAERYLDYEGVPSAGRRGIGEALMDEYAARLQLREDA